MPGLGASFGRGAATNYQQDLANSDCILIMGSNMAEAHPVGFRWPMKAKEKGATLIHVDPRFTRTSALCDVHVGIRAGSDIAFLGGLVNYVLTHERWFKEYVLAYTNASRSSRRVPGHRRPRRAVQRLRRGQADRHLRPARGALALRLRRREGEEAGVERQTPMYRMQAALGCTATAWTRERLALRYASGCRPQRQASRTATRRCNTRAASSRS